jgi:hypothetical protein
MDNILKCNSCMCVVVFKMFEALKNAGLLININLFTASALGVRGDFKILY